MKKIYKLADMHRMIEGRHGFFVYNYNDKFVGRALELYGEYGEHEVVLFSKLIRESDIVLEIGANIGSQTVALSKFVGKLGMVYAFEPQPVVFQNLCANISVNALQNVRAFPFACGNTNGHVFLPSVNYNQEGNFGGISMATEGTEKIQLVCLDELFSEQNNIRLMKIDVEGMESAVISGLKKTIEHCKPFLYVENDRTEKSKELIELIWSLGYKCFWHCPPLYNQNNFYGNNQNIYPGISAFNMLCIPDETTNIEGISLQDAPLITDSSSHPLIRK